jgi:anti-anti-sigma factor
VIARAVASLSPVLVLRTEGGIVRNAQRLDVGERSNGAAFPEPFRVEVRPDRRRVFVEPRGELDLDTADQLRATVDDLALRGFEAIVIDLRATTFLDSSGLHLLITQAGRTDARVTLIDGPGVVSRLFDLAGVRHILSFEDA